MRRVLPMIAVAALTGLGTPARADCAQEIATMRAHLAATDDPAKHRELELLLAKAQDDNKAGHAQLCTDDLRYAQQLVN